MAESRPPLVRGWLLAVFGVVLLGAAGFGAYTLVRLWRERVALAVARIAAHKQQVTVARENRQKVAVHVAPGPLPLALPLLGADGVDTDGYPHRYVDRVGLRSLLHAHWFKELTSYVEQLQSAFEADPRKEYWPSDAADAFSSAEPEIVANLDAWVSATPDSFAPYLARGSHYEGAMWARRGHEFASKTAEEDFTAMREAARKAVADLDRSLELRPKLVAAMCEEISVGMATADLERLSEMKDRALKVCPGCLKVRIAYMGTLTPRWGGTYEAMRAFVMESPLRLNPRFRMLAGQVDLDRAELAEIANDDAGALVAIDDAAKADNHFSYLVERARILLRLKRYDEAVATLDRADAQRPMHPPILAQRAIAHYGRQEYVGAGRDLLTTLRLDPTDSDAKAYIDYVVKGVLYQARQLDLAGKHEEALEVAELGLDLAPTDHDAQNTHAWTVLGDATTPERVAALKTKVAASPGDFRAVQQLDYALNKQGQLEPIPPMWNAYLAVHADDGRAYMERAGAYHHLGRNAEAMADTQRACQLGINEGCERAAR